MNAFTEGLYLELRSIGSNVAVQALCPGFTHSEFHDKLAVTREGLGTVHLLAHCRRSCGRNRSKAFAKGKLFVIPGWRYRWIVGTITKLPIRARLFFEAAKSAVAANGNLGADQDP